MIPHDRPAGDGVMDSVEDSKGYWVAHPRPDPAGNWGNADSPSRLPQSFQFLKVIVRLSER